MSSGSRYIRKPAILSVKLKLILKMIKRFDNTYVYPILFCFIAWIIQINLFS